MRKLISIFLLFMIVTVTFAQEIKVTSMEQLTNDLTARVNSRKDYNGEYCALIKVQLPVPGLQFEGNVIGNTEYHTNEYFVYMTSGSKGLMIRHPKYQTLFVNFPDYGVSGVETRSTYALKLQADKLEADTVLVSDTVMVVDTIKVHTPVSVEANSNISYEINEEGVLTIKDVPTIKKPINFYTEGKFQAGSLMAVGGGFGTYIHNVNIEAFALVGMTESKEVFFLPSDISQTAYSYTYKANNFGAKIGYGIICSDNVRITPQVGIGIASISGSEKQKGTSSTPDASSAYAVPVSVGVRAEYLFGKYFGISLAPEFAFTASKSDAFTRISEICSDVKNFGEGFNARVGIFVCF